MLAASFVRRGRDGLWTIVDGGWDWIQIDSSPFRVSLVLLIEIETGTIEPTTILDLRLAVRNPKGFQVHEQKQAIAVEDLLVRRSRVAVVLEFSGSLPGLSQDVKLSEDFLLRFERQLTNELSGAWRRSLGSTIGAYIRDCEAIVFICSERGCTRLPALPAQLRANRSAGCECAGDALPVVRLLRFTLRSRLHFEQVLGHLAKSAALTLGTKADSGVVGRCHQHE